MARPIIRGRFPSDAELDRKLRETLRDVGEDSELIFQAHARYKTGRMARGIKSEAIARGTQVIVTATARDPLTGFDYVAVTRFGHRKAFIEPVARGRASVIATGRARGRGHRAALRFTINGRVMYRRRVKGFKPAFDWAERAMPEVNANADRAMVALGRRIVVSSA